MIILLLEQNTHPSVHTISRKFHSYLFVQLHPNRYVIFSLVSCCIHQSVRSSTQARFFSLLKLSVQVWTLYPSSLFTEHSVPFLSKAYLNFKWAFNFLLGTDILAVSEDQAKCTPIRFLSLLGFLMPSLICLAEEIDAPSTLLHFLMLLVFRETRTWQRKPHGWLLQGEV